MSDIDNGTCVLRARVVRKEYAKNEGRSAR
jgi:hypothetical protein